MRTYLFHTPKWIESVYPGLVWKINTKEQAVFLTFDDGPDELATEYVLDQLDRFSAKATFFCIGENIRKNPGLFLKVMEKGHAFGNHTFRHLNGWKTGSEVYLRDVVRFEEEAKKFSAETNLFRPPYGRIRKSQFIRLKNKYKAIMWSHQAGDFDRNLHVNSARKALLKGRSGSIFLFHDSFTAYKNLKKLLPIVLDHYSSAGYHFKSLSDNAIN